MNHQEITAQLVAYVAMRKKAANLRGAMDDIKESIGAYLDSTGEQRLIDTSTEIFAHWKEREGNRHLDCRQLDKETLFWAAQNGLLDGNLTAIDAQKNSAPQLVAIRQAVYRDPPSRYVDIVAPSWARQQEIAQRLNQVIPIEPPAPPPAPIQQPQPAPAQPTPGSGELCPVHGKARHSPKSGGLFCPSKLQDGSWCKWTTARKAS